jgi:HEPN domain-containing protein
MPDKDPAHWLYRLAPDEWLRAADNELGHAEEALGRRAIRPAVTHARRAAGMAANALLWQGDRPAWGRSYMEHVIAVCDDGGVPEAIRDAARRLRDTPPAPPELVKLGPPDRSAVEAAAAIVAWARGQLSRNG